MSDKSRDMPPKGITRRDFLQTAGIATLAMGSGALSLAPGKVQASESPASATDTGGQTSPRQHNVLFVMSD
mgnify:FL=1